MNKRQFLLLIEGIAYVIILGSIIPILIINLNLFELIYNYFAELAYVGVFFLIFVISTCLFFSFIYSTLIQEKRSYNIGKSKKKKKNPRYYASILLIIGLPIMIWLILGIIGYYSITEVTGGLGIFVQNGFLVSLIALLYFCIFPGIILCLKKNLF